MIPPYEQLLVGMGAGAVSSAAAWCGAWMALVVSTGDPPHEQLLVGGVLTWWVLLMILNPETQTNDLKWLCSV
jgi:hypothetical protein